jgi:lysophospholipase L1-like esterase
VHTDPDAVRVLCFGDSNTHGAPDDDPDYARLPADRRWTGLLQAELGDQVEVIEEGLGGRTTDLDDPDTPGAGGRAYFAPCLRSHKPLDVAVIMLGTNDLQARFDRTPGAVAEMLHGYLDDLAAHGLDRHGGVPAAVLGSPIRIDDTTPLYEKMTADSFDHTSVARSGELAREIHRVADLRGVGFADAATVARPGADGLHLSPDSHAPLAAYLATVVRRVHAERAASSAVS